MPGLCAQSPLGARLKKQANVLFGLVASKNIAKDRACIFCRCFFLVFQQCISGAYQSCSEGIQKIEIASSFESNSGIFSETMFQRISLSIPS